MQPKIHIRYSTGRSRSGSISALFYIESDIDVYGWYAEAKGHRFTASFFMIENFYTERPTVLCRSVEDDVYGPWIADTSSNGDEIRCPVPELVRHELERIQSRFIEEWFFFGDDPAAAIELETFRELRMPVHALNIKPHKFKRFEKKGADWVHSTAGSDLNVIDFLEKFWHHSEKETAR